MPTTDDDTTSRLRKSVENVPDWHRRDVERRVDLGVALGRAMAEKNLSAKDVAERINNLERAGNRVKPIDIALLRSANRVPTLKRIALIEEALGVDLITVLIRE